MSKWIAEFDLEDGDTMPEHMDLEYKGAKIDLHCKPLEQELCEDAISRRAVLNTLDSTDKFLDETRTVESYKTLLEECYKNLPPVTPIRPKGHWIGQKKIGFGEWKECIVPLKDGYVTDSCSCSECGEWLTGSDEYQCSGNYCPNCGAEMENEE